jgi:hypothetical protein
MLSTIGFRQLHANSQRHTGLYREVRGYFIHATLACHHAGKEAMA